MKKELYLLMVDRRVAALQAFTLIHLAVAGAVVAGLIQLLVEPSGISDEALGAFNASAVSAVFGLVTIGLLMGMRFRAANIVAEIDDSDFLKDDEGELEVLVRTRKRLDWTLAMAASSLQVFSLGLALLLFRVAVI